MMRDAGPAQPAGNTPLRSARPTSSLDPAVADELEQLRLQLQDQRQRALVLEAQVAAMVQSTSWRITKPLRALGAVRRWVRSGQAASSLRSVAPRLRAALRQRGLLGVLRRLPVYLRSLPRMLRERPPPQGAAEVSSGHPLAPQRMHPETLDGASLPPLLHSTLTVVIPTLNAGPEFAYLLRKLRTQTHVGEIEIVVVDSGSTDGTVAHALAAGAQVVEISPAQFSHSHARNLGAEQASGELLLFMVQDAYPLGDRWLYGLMRYLQEHRDQGVVAVSCTEYCRDDSDMMYECSIATHYEYLGCKSFDRVGELRGTDHESLRTMGQLSNVACLIPRQRFLMYRFRGRFAEDLDLGVRLIRDGLRIAMLASVKVIHSHNRKPHYYLKRTFVSVMFLAESFPDFELPICASPAGLLAGVTHVARCLDSWVQTVLQGGAQAGPMAEATDRFGPMAEATDRFLAMLASQGVSRAGVPSSLDLGDARVVDLITELLSASARVQADSPPGGTAEFDRAARFFVDDFVMRLNHFNRYAAPIHDGAAEPQRLAWADAAAKSFATSLGYALAVLCGHRASRPDAERRWLDGVALQLSSGV